MQTRRIADWGHLLPGWCTRHQILSHFFVKRGLRILRKTVNLNCTIAICMPMNLPSYKIPPFIVNAFYVVVATASLCGIITSVYHNSMLAIKSRTEEMKLKHRAIDLDYQLQLLTIRTAGLRQELKRITDEAGMDTPPFIGNVLPESDARERLSSEISMQENQASFLRAEISTNRMMLEKSGSGYDLAVVVIELVSLLGYLFLYGFIGSRFYRLRL